MMSSNLVGARARASDKEAISARGTALAAAAQTVLALAKDPNQIVSGDYSKHVLTIAERYEEYLLTGHFTSQF